jgi:hypothetical protein
MRLCAAPLEIVSDTGPTTADPVRSLWQTASVALLVTHAIAFFQKPRDGLRLR